MATLVLRPVIQLHHPRGRAPSEPTVRDRTRAGHPQWPGERQEQRVLKLAVASEPASPVHYFVALLSGSPEPPEKEVLDRGVAWSGRGRSARSHRPMCGRSRASP